MKGRSNPWAGTAQSGLTGFRGFFSGFHTRLKYSHKFPFSLAFKRDCFKIVVSFRPLPSSSLSLNCDRRQGELLAAAAARSSGWGEV